MPASKINYLNESNTVSLLSATTGVLEIAKIPVVDKPDWIIPQALILTIDEYTDRIWTYRWKNQDVAIYHLLPKNMPADRIVVVESITDAHRIGLQIQGEVTFHTVRLSDLKDATEEELQSHNFIAQSFDDNAQEQIVASWPPVVAHEQDFVFQPVMFNGELCVVPELDKLSHYLVDLDS